MGKEVEIRFEMSLPMSLHYWLKEQARASGMPMSVYVRSRLIEERKRVQEKVVHAIQKET